MESLFGLDGSRKSSSSITYRETINVKQSTLHTLYFPMYTYNQGFFCLNWFGFVWYGFCTLSCRSFQSLDLTSSLMSVFIYIRTANENDKGSEWIRERERQKMWLCLYLPAKIDVVRSQIRIHQPLSDSKFSIVVFHAHKHDNEWHSHCNMSDDKRIQEYTNSGTERKREKEWGGRNCHPNSK